MRHLALLLAAALAVPPTPHPGRDPRLPDLLDIPTQSAEPLQSPTPQRTARADPTAIPPPVKTASVPRVSQSTAGLSPHPSSAVVPTEAQGPAESPVADVEPVGPTVNPAPAIRPGPTGTAVGLFALLVVLQLAAIAALLVNLRRRRAFAERYVQRRRQIENARSEGRHLRSVE